MMSIVLLPEPAVDCTVVTEIPLGLRFVSYLLGMVLQVVESNSGFCTESFYQPHCHYFWSL
jgi:hypothetical protein